MTVTDTVSKEKRSAMMSRIRGRDTVPELLVRSALHSRGYRFRLCVRKLPGAPDIVLPKWRTVVFVHGCFWHGHSCKLFKLPGSNTEFWGEKISRNRRNDAKARRALEQAGWRVLTVRECELRGKTAARRERFFDGLARRISHHNTS